MSATTSELKKVTIFTDGACIKNPGPGGYAAVLLHNGKRKEISGGFRLTTNNRMEIMAAIIGLRALKYPCAVTLYTDSQYLVNSIMKGWARRWRDHGWLRTPTQKARNYDLWEQLLDVCSSHRVKFKWVRGHAGNKENERCDTLSVQAAEGNQLAIDFGYEEWQARASDHRQGRVDHEPELFEGEAHADGMLE
jgi:ribonuclease HI